jgi:hypothetical protein
MINWCRLERDAGERCGTKAAFFWAAGCRFDYGRLDANGVTIPGTGSFGRIISTKTGEDMRELQVNLRGVF